VAKALCFTPHPISCKRSKPSGLLETNESFCGFYFYTKAGIMLDDLLAADMRSRALFEDDAGKRAHLMEALDQITVGSVNEPR
jgi:hypothetical protein